MRKRDGGRGGREEEGERGRETEGGRTEVGSEGELKSITLHWSYVARQQCWDVFQCVLED